MERIKKFLANKGPGYYLLLPAIIFAAIGLYSYMKNGVTEFTTELSPEVLAAYWVGIVCCAFSLIKEWKAVKYVGYLALLYAFLESLCVQATYIANVFVSIDGNSFSTGFITMAVCSLLAVVTSLLAALFNKKKEAAS